MQRAPRFSPDLPLYTQIAERLLEQIHAGELAPGARLLPERIMAEQLGVNRMTLRHALAVLESQGVLIRRRGAGTYVAEPKIERHAATLVSFTTSMKQRGLNPGARVLSLECRLADPSLARELGVPPGSRVYAVRRLRLLNSEPVLLESFALPAARFPRFERHNLGKRSVYEILNKEYGVQVVRARQSLEPVVASAYEAKLLGIPKGAPLMLEQRIGFDQTGRPVEAGHDLYRGDRFRFITEIAPLEMG